MIDLALFAFLGAFVALGLRRPFLWVLAYLYIDILAPQKIGWSLTSALPISYIAFLLAFGGWALLDRKEGARFTMRQGLLALLLAYCFWTTQNADFPVEAATKWDWVWKALVFAIFLPLTLTTRLRLESALLVMVLTAGAIIIEGGMKTVAGGGGYGELHLFVNDNSNIYESSTLATVAVAIIPLVLWLVRHGKIFPDAKPVRLFAGALIFACLLIPIGTEARTGLLCIAMLAVLMLRDVKRRFLYVFGAGALVLMTAPFLPQSYYERMGLISAHDEDQSASTRVAVWRWTMDYAAANPMGGGFDSYRGNSFTYRMPVVEGSGSTQKVVYREVVDRGRAFHSAIFEMLGEQGYPGLLLWLLLHGSGLVQMEILRRRWRQRSDPGDAWQAPLASALQVANLIYLVGSLFQGIAYQPFVLLLIGLQVALWSHCQRRDSQRRETLRKAAREARRSAAPVQPAMP